MNLPGSALFLKIQLIPNEECISKKLQEFIKNKETVRKLTLYYISNTHSSN
jgi:hypothetical protein